MMFQILSVEVGIWDFVRAFFGQKKLRAFIISTWGVEHGCNYG